MELSVRLRVDHVDHTAAVVARVEQLAQASGVFLEETETSDADGEVQWIARAGSVAMSVSLHPRTMQLALASLFHWALADVKSLTVEIYETTLGGSWLSFETASALAEMQAGCALSVRVLRESDESDVLALLANESAQIVDARSLAQYLGLDAQQQVSGHLEHAMCVAFDAVFDEEQGAFRSVDAIVDELEMAGVDMEIDAVVMGSTATEAAAVATALVLAGHRSVRLSLVPLTDALVAKLPIELRSGIFMRDVLMYATESGEFDLSPDAPSRPQQQQQQQETNSTLDKEYAERLNPKNKTKTSDDDGEEDGENNKDKEEEVCWLDAHERRYFDMPRHMSKASFLEASRDIYRVVSFVLAPLGFPLTLQERFSVSEIKTRCSALFQDVIEVGSDLVYHHRGLTEGAMAMSVHKWVEQRHDAECTQQVRAINELLDVLYEPPVFIEVPDVSDARVLEIAQQLQSRLTEAIKKRAPWALETTSDNDEEESEQENEQEKETDDPATGWRHKVYPSVVYALGFMPPAPKKKHQRLSTLQIKSFIQAVAEAVWEVISQEPCSQIEYQALFDTVGGSDAGDATRQQLLAIKHEAERALYVVKHSLLRSLEREEHVVETLVGVRDATEDGHRALRSGRHEVALSYFSSALSKLPVFHAEVAPVLVGRIKCHIQLGHLDQAQHETQVLLKIDPFSVGAYACLGEIHEKLQHHEDAMQHFVTAFILDGSRSQDHATAIDRVARSVGRLKAKDIFQNMVLQDELPTQWLVESYFDSFEHDVDHAARVPFDIEKSMGVDAAELPVDKLIYRAVHQKRKKLYKAAQSDIQAALARTTTRETTTELESEVEVDPSLRALALNLHASFLYVAGDVHSAIDAISESLALEPLSVNGLIKKGGFLSEIGDMDEATACFNQAANADPNDADVYLHMGQKELLEGDFYAAVQCLRRAISRSEALPVTHVSYGMALYKSGSIYQAMDVFEDAAKTFPESPEVHLFYGEVLADQGDYAKAMRHFVRALALSPQCPLPFLNAGRVYVSTNDPMRAIAHFQQALAIDPRCSSAHLDIAQVLFAQGRTDEAFTHFESAAHCCRFLPEVEEVCSAQEMAKMQERVTDILGVDLRHIMRSKQPQRKTNATPLQRRNYSTMAKGGNHPAFHYAVLVSMAGGTGYVMKRHLPSLLGGTALGIGFLGAGLLVLTDTITDHTFGHGTGIVMSGIITSVMSRHALLTRLPGPAALAGVGAISAGYHIQRIANPPPRMRYVPGAPPVPSSVSTQ